MPFSYISCEGSEARATLSPLSGSEGSEAHDGGANGRRD